MSDEELYARYKRKSFTEAITSENCPFSTRIYYSYRYIESCSLMDRGIKSYREIENHMFKVIIPKQSGCKLPRFYNYYMCYSKSKGEACLFLKRINRTAKQIATTIDEKRLTDIDLIPYLKLHNLIKKVKPWDYDKIIRRVAEYCFETGWDVRTEKIARWLRFRCTVGDRAEMEE